MIVGGSLFDRISIPSTISRWPIGLEADHVYLNFKVNDGCQKDIYAKNEFGYVKYQCTWRTIDVYNCGVQSQCIMSPEMPFRTLRSSIYSNMVDPHKIVGMVCEKCC